MSADDWIKIIDHIVGIAFLIAFVLYMVGAFDKDSG
jgi:hypothetical protein